MTQVQLIPYLVDYKSLNAKDNAIKERQKNMILDMVLTLYHQYSAEIKNRFQITM